MKLEIKNRWNGTIIFSHEVESNTIAITVKAAVANDADLSGTNLSRANLRGADLSGADLSNANLFGANLSDANLNNADLSDADLSRANLSDANLSLTNLFGTNLSRANLFGANLFGANLSGANLSRADLFGANLFGANLTPVRDDIWAVLSSAPGEVAALIDALKYGRVDGSTYSGACSCLVGTIAATRGTSVENLGTLKPNSSRPAECFFMGIRSGDTPETSQASALALDWCQEWLDRMTLAFAS